MEYLEAQVKLLSEKQNPTNALAPVVHNSPFTMEIWTAVLPEAFTMPQIQQYSDTSDPVEHAELYHDQMMIKGAGDNAMCRIFPYTLTGPAKSWFRSLKVSSVSSPDHLLKDFVHEFGYASTQDITSSKLAFIKQGDSESLAEYVTRFHQEVLRTGTFGHQHTLTHFEKNLRLGKLWWSFQKHRPLSYGEARSGALQQIEMDEKCNLKWEEDRVEVVRNKEKPKRADVPQVPSRAPRVHSPPRPTPRGRGLNIPSVPRVTRVPQVPFQAPRVHGPPLPPEQREAPQKSRYDSFHHLNQSPEKFFYHIRDTGMLRPPKPIRKYPNMKRSLKYCEFHEDFGHSTAECFHLREEIESLILSGYLKEFMADMREARKFLEQNKGKQVANPHPEAEIPQGSKKGVYVRMIAGGPTLAGEFRRAIKRYSKPPILDRPGKEVNFACQNQLGVPHHPPFILFTEQDAEDVLYPHDDALVITLKVTTGKVARTLVDTGSSVDIIFKSALDQLLIESPKITLCATPLIGFAGDMVIPKGIITLPVTLGKVPHRIVHMIDFLIVDHPDAYNIILGRPFLAITKAAISMHYLAMKIPTAGEIITIKGDQQSARGCYSVASKVSYQIATNMFLEGYPVSTRPFTSLSKRALARCRRVARKKAQRSMNSQVPQAPYKARPMEVDMVAPRAPLVPQSPNSVSMGEVKVPLDPRVPKDKKRGTPA
ncbi:uncharacterized protein LOC127899388 [Citrus sinensis]|uniref:uncharacterized protein LOC112099909 n=1 Tax=Citrus clementina TaxID=85681 RepID=UPI000CED0AF4|nr:uncharacterized protein LOC112099909 [Citrus x clementina]XP_052288717.1 uncharacterized protein LOC127899388 [Citrus sinensis]